MTRIRFPLSNRNCAILAMAVSNAKKDWEKRDDDKSVVFSHYNTARKSLLNLSKNELKSMRQDIEDAVAKQLAKLWNEGYEFYQAGWALENIHYGYAKDFKVDYNDEIAYQKHCDHTKGKLFYSDCYFYATAFKRVFGKDDKATYAESKAGKKQQDDAGKLVVKRLALDPTTVLYGIAAYYGGGYQSFGKDFNLTIQFHETLCVGDLQQDDEGSGETDAFDCYADGLLDQLVNDSKTPAVAHEISDSIYAVGLNRQRVISAFVRDLGLKRRNAKLLREKLTAGVTGTLHFDD